METAQFWDSLPPDPPSDLWQKKPTLPVELIVKTVCEKAVYLSTENNLSLSAIKPEIYLSASQQIALKLCLANSPVMVIQGAFGSGKTRIAKVLVQELVKQQKSILVLTNHHQALWSYHSLPGFQFRENDHMGEMFTEQYLLNLSMDFLPNYLLSDNLLNQLRSPGKLEKWVSILQKNPELKELKSLLKSEFPDCSVSRLKLLSDALKKLLPLLQQQLWLQQRTASLSPEAKLNLAQEMRDTGSIPLFGTISDFLSQNQNLKEMCFDCVIVEEAEYLSWGQLMCLASITNKLILLGNLPMDLTFVARKAFTKFPPLFWLGEFLLPSYRYKLSQQFRLHDSFAKPILETLYHQWINTPVKTNVFSYPQLKSRWLWQNVCSTPKDNHNQWEGTRLLKFLSGLGAAQAEKIGILALTEAQRDWLRANCPSDFQKVFIGTCVDWIAREVEILLISCVGYPQQLQTKDLAIALTRPKSYLILFGDYSLWSKESSPLQALVNHPNLHREREVSYL